MAATCGTRDEVAAVASHGCVELRLGGDEGFGLADAAASHGNCKKKNCAMTASVALLRKGAKNIRVCNSAEAF